MSLRGDKYETAEEVRFRLENTVVLYDGRPVWITRVRDPEPADGEIARVYFNELPLRANRQEETRKFLSSRKFDLSPFKMGYMNLDGDVVFLSRTPVRQNRQGLSAGSCTISDVTGQRNREHGFGQIIDRQEFVDMVMSNYPSFKEASDMIRDGATGVALSNQYALRRDGDLGIIYLYNRFTKVAAGFPGEILRLPKKNAFLKEQLAELKIPTA